MIQKLSVCSAIFFLLQFRSLTIISTGGTASALHPNNKMNQDILLYVITTQTTKNYKRRVMDILLLPRLSIWRPESCVPTFKNPYHVSSLNRTLKPHHTEQSGRRRRWVDFESAPAGRRSSACEVRCGRCMDGRMIYLLNNTTTSDLM